MINYVYIDDMTPFVFELRFSTKLAHRKLFKNKF